MTEQNSNENLTEELLPDEQVDQESQQLVAYLDGELDAQSSVELEQRLAEDAEFRLRLEQLQKAWDFLDDLPRTQQNEDFTRSTVELITVSAQDDLHATKRDALQKHMISWILRGGLVTITLLVGWFVGDWYFGRDQRQLIEDLPVIDRLDEFRLTEDLEFLQQLVELGLFDEESPNDE